MRAVIPSKLVLAEAGSGNPEYVRIQLSARRVDSRFRGNDKFSYIELTLSKKPSLYDFFSYATVGFVGVGKWFFDGIKKPFTYPYACFSALSEKLVSLHLWQFFHIVNRI